MGCNGLPEEICTLTPGRKGADQNIRIEHEPHDTTAKISSSVWNPALPASCKAARRSSSNAARIRRTREKDTNPLQRC